MSSTNGHKMNVEHRGELEDISRPPSNRTRLGMKVGSSVSGSNSSAGTASMRFKSGTGIAASLELLTPSEVLERDDDLELEDLGSDSDYTDDDDCTETTSAMNTGRTSDMFHIAEPITNMRLSSQVSADGATEADDDDYQVSRQLALFENESEEEIEVKSDEERDIIKEIKNEITKQVKEEMTGELQVYKEARERLDRGAQPQHEHADLDGLEPKLKEAILKMRKLDKILEKKIRREKEVKRERILLQKRLRQELEDLKEGKKSITVEEKRNMEKYLALELPPSHNAGVHVDEPSPPVTPVFQTQVPDDGAAATGGSQSASQDDTHSPASMGSASRAGGDSIRAGSETGTTASAGTSHMASTTTSSNGTQHTKHKRRKNKDFIKRNMELAADAGNAIAMTDDEKKRLEDLLGDLDALPEVTEEEGATVADDIFSNPYQVVLSSGEGFLPSLDESQRLEAIDSRLKQLLPPEDYESICSTPTSHVSSDRSEDEDERELVEEKEGELLMSESDTDEDSGDESRRLFSRSHLPSALDVDLDQLGEQALRENKEDRDLQKRLHDIEQELDHMTEAVEMEMQSPTLTEGQLQDLLDQCARTMSRATAETNSLAQSSARSGMTSAMSSIYDNPPKLPDDVLQSLLADARRTIMGSATPTEGGTSTRNNDALILESVSEDTIKELLQNSRATSRAMSRSSSQASCHSSHHIYEGITQRGKPEVNSWATPRNNMTHPGSGGNINRFTGYGEFGDKYTASVPRKPFLPEIDPKGTMSTQKLTDTMVTNNEEAFPVRPPSSRRSSSITVINSFASTVKNSYEGQDSITSIPHPPSESRKSSAGRSSRTLSPMTSD